MTLLARRILGKKFVPGHMADDPLETHNTGAMLKEAHQRLYPLQCRPYGNFYRCTIEGGGVTVWQGNATAQDREAIQSERSSGVHFGPSRSFGPGVGVRPAPSYVVWSPVPQHWNQDKEQFRTVQEQFLPTGNG